MNCTACGGELDTAYKCMKCGHWNPPENWRGGDRITNAVNGICTMGNGWCPIHGDKCPATRRTAGVIE